jgi:hypothetical protein
MNLTIKTDQFNNPLFYQYQLKYNTNTTENIKITNKDGALLSPKIEYATYIKDNTLQLKDLVYSIADKPLMYDSLNKNVYVGKIEDDRQLIFSRLSDTFKLYKTRHSFMYNGELSYVDGALPAIENKTFSFYLCNRYDGETQSVNFAHFSDLNFRIIKTSSNVWTIISSYGNEVSIPLFTYTAADVGKWYRFDIQNVAIATEQFPNLGVYLTIYEYVLNTQTGLTTINTKFATRDVCSGNFLSKAEARFKLDKMGLFDVCLLEKPRASNERIWIERYDDDIMWQDQPISQVTDADRAIRLLFKSDEEAIITYNTKDRGEFEINHHERINYEPIYAVNQYSVQDDVASYDNIAQVILDGELLWSDINNLQDNSNIVIYWLITARNKIKMFIGDDNKVHMSNGIFKAENDESYYYKLLEYTGYDNPPDLTTEGSWKAYSSLAKDWLRKIEPSCVKVHKEIATILDSNNIQIHPFIVYDNDFPTYKIENLYEEIADIRFTEAIDGVEFFTRNIEILSSNKSYKSFRGINIFINDKLIDNAEIVDYDKQTGLINLRSSIKLEDDVRVSYLKKESDFTLIYPLLDKLVSSEVGGIGDANNIQIFMLPHKYGYYNDTYDLPGANRQYEKLCYRLSDWTDPFLYKSCTTNEIIKEFMWYKNNGGLELLKLDEHYQLLIQVAEIILTNQVRFSDARVRGAAIKEVFQNTIETVSPSFTDIGYLADGKQLYNDCIFVKMSKKVLYDLRDRYYPDDEESALIFLKSQLMSYLSSGCFYIIIDENNEPWDNPYPLELDGILEALE